MLQALQLLATEASFDLRNEMKEVAKVACNLQLATVLSYLMD
jgi:hypothetical protein